MAEQTDEFADFDSDVNFDLESAPEGEVQDEQGPGLQQPQSIPPRPRPKQRPPQRRPQPQPVTPQMAAASAQSMPHQQTQQQQSIQQASQAQAPPQARYVPYEMPKRIGLLDRVAGKPLIEDEDMLRVIMAQLADLKNDIEEIKSYYN